MGTVHQKLEPKSTPPAHIPTEAANTSLPGHGMPGGYGHTHMGSNAGIAAPAHRGCPGSWGLPSWVGPVRNQVPISIPHLQAKFRMNQPGDHFEQEADRIADTLVARGTSAGAGTMPATPPTITPLARTAVQSKCADCEHEDEKEEPTVQRKATAATASGTEGSGIGAGPGDSGRPAGGLAGSALPTGGGSPLPQAARGFYESGIGADFSGVRVHTDTHAARMSQQINARAFTHGNNIYFGAGEYSPGTTEGRRLLAHELVHTVQQGSRGGGMVMRKVVGPGNPTTPRDNRKGRHVNRPYKVYITQAMLKMNEEDQKKAIQDKLIEEHPETKGFEWIRFAPLTQSHLANGYWVWITDNSIAPISPKEEKEIAKREKKFSSNERKAIDEEAYNRFWEKTGHNRGKRLGSTGNDAEMAKYLKGIRDDVVRERVLIDALPENVRAAIMDERTAATLDPRDYQAVLRIANQLSTLTPEELAEYRSRSTLDTQDFREIEQSVQAFIAQRKARMANEADRRKTATQLYGLEKLYTLYKAFLPHRYAYANDPAKHGGGYIDPTDTQRMLAIEAGDAFEDALHAAGFSTIDEFEVLIHTYTHAFRNEAVQLTYEVLDRYKHMLLEERERYSHADELGKLMQAVAETGARDKYTPYLHTANPEQSKQADNRAVPTFQVPQTSHVDALKPDPEAIPRAMFQIAEEDVTALAGTYPLLGDRDFPRASIAKATSQLEVERIIAEYVSARVNSIDNTRADIEEDNDRVFLLDSLIALAKKQQNITEGSVLNAIVDDEVGSIKAIKFLKNLVLSIVAIAVSFAGPIGQLVAFGISAYMAADEYKTYLSESDAHAVGLLAEDPNFAWVVVAIVGAGIDLAVLAHSAKAIKPVVEAFEIGEEAGNVVALEARLAKLTEVEESLKSTILNAAKARSERIAAWKALGSTGGKLFDITGAVSEMAAKLTSAVYYSIKSGIREFQLFVKTREAFDLIGDVAKLAPEELAKLKQAYVQAVEDVEAIAAHGKGLGMTDEEVEAFVQLRPSQPKNSAADLKLEMSAWKATDQGGLPTSSLNSQSAIVDELVNIALRKKSEGAWLQPGEKVIIDRLRNGTYTDLRLANVVHAKGGSALQEFNITVSRNSVEYQNVLQRLAQERVGRTKGIEDRIIVADTFFAKVESGVKPVLITQDKGIFNSLLRISGVKPEKLGREVSLAYPNGFDVTINSRTITVIPIPGK